MDFARGLLEKYGWTEGKGLGKNETGISEALKPSLKFDTTGIGHDHSDQFTFKWWEIAFNNAANRIEVQKSDSGGALISTDETKELHLSTKKPWTAKLKSENSLEYGSFVKTEKLTGEGELISLKSDKDSVSFVDTTTNLSDEELFRICGGRTAHKAARHGHKLVGKLARVIEQEKKLLSGYKEAVPTVENTEEDGVRRKKKKKRKYNHSSEDFVENMSVDNVTIEVKNADEIKVDPKKVKKRKKKRKAENFCEVESEQQSDSFIVESSVVEVKKKKKKSKIREVNCTEYENPNDCIEYPSLDGAEENTKSSKKKKKKKKL
ncbi:hypothetical protein J437_LFUL014461 [Ladona fulva]|uniref:G patch domain-containing protein 4 n=1 Tax=Ladona fulva TaxID=123851 RepID=A0A8K0KHF3_LADFU|nr:hypothetical protein J437_LFUL014461 [Ladona fulva]